MGRTSSALISALIIGCGAFFISGCQKKEAVQQSPSSIQAQTEAIEYLTKRLEQLERLVGLEATKSLNDKKAPDGPIKSLTFRIGTEDDRLRIYWADGSSSDLPCTKEQLIWVCG